MRATVTNVTERRLGAVLTADMSVGAVTGVVDDWTDLDEAGTVEIGGELLAYEIVDEVIEFGSPAASAHSTDDWAYQYPPVYIREAQVAPFESQDAFEARVPVAIWDKLPVGVRQVGIDDETVDVDVLDDEGVVTDVLGQEPVMTAEYLDTTTFTAPPSDGTPPAVSPDASVQGGIGFLYVSWMAVTNADPVAYDIYLDTSSGFTPGDATFVLSTGATNAFLRRTAAGDTLAYNTDYYVRIVARDEDGEASPGDEATAQLVAASGPDIAVNGVLADHILAGSVTSEKIDSSIVVSGQIKTAADGQRVELRAPDEDGHGGGLELIGPSGETIVYLPSDEGQRATFNGDVVANDVAIEGKASFLSATNEVGAGAELNLSAGALGDPTVAPSVGLAWDSRTLTGYTSGTGYDGVCYTATGGTGGATACYYVARYNSLQQIVVDEFNASTGARIRTLDEVTSWSTALRIAGIAKFNVSGTHRVFVLVRRAWGSITEWYVFAWNLSTGSFYNYVDVTSNFPGTAGDRAQATAAFGSDSSYLLLATHNTASTAGNLRIVKLNPSTLADSGTGFTTSGYTFPFATDGTARLTGIVNDGSAIWIQQSGWVGLNHKLSTAGVYQDDNYFTGGNGAGNGLAWNGTQLASFNVSDSVLYMASDWAWTTESPVYWFSYRWEDASHHTDVSPRTQVDLTWWRRSKVRITPPGLPSGATKTLIYVERGASDPGDTGVRLQAATTYVDSEVTVPITMKQFNATGGTNAGTNDFGAGTAAVIESSGGAGLAYTNGPRITGAGELRLPQGTTTQRNAGPANAGDVLINTTKVTPEAYYEGRWNTLIPPGVIQMFGSSTIPDGWLNCNGQAVSRTTYAALYAVLGTTFGSGDGSTTFNVPDLRARSGLGVGTNITLGQNEGTTESSRDEQHKHAVSITSGTPSAAPSRKEGTGSSWNSPGDSHTHSVSGNTDLGTPPFLGLYYIVKT